MKRLCMISLFALFLLLAPCASAQYWDEARSDEARCSEDRAGCQLLRMVMTGSFDCIDPSDSLNLRVLSAALAQLCLVQEADVAHFAQEENADEQVLTTNYYIALANCLWADILVGGAEDEQTGAVRRVLLLFLNPESEENAWDQMYLIRSKLDDDLIHSMAEAAALPADFVSWLIESENWRERE